MIRITFESTPIPTPIDIRAVLCRELGIVPLKNATPEEIADHLEASGFGSAAKALREASGPLESDHER